MYSNKYLLTRDNKKHQNTQQSIHYYTKQPASRKLSN